jgi:beta-glucosidase
MWNFMKPKEFKTRSAGYFSILMLLLACLMAVRPGLAATITAEDGDWFEDSATKNIEMFGAELVLTISGLPPGTYAVEIDAAEHYVHAAGQRVMTVSCGDQVLAANVDLFKEVGRNRTYTIKGSVVHRGDFANGPLLITLKGVVENAKFDAVRLKDAAGQIVAETSAAQLKKELFKAELPRVSGPELWPDATLTPAARAADLVRRLSLPEKAAQLQMAAPAIPRLGIPAYDWWNEALHGVARAGVATVFPQAIGAAATWNPQLWKTAASVIADEARAKHHDFARRHGGNSARYFGLDMWSPNVNIFRDPRWGRGQETYGEDPYLSGRMGVGFVQGLQGDDPRYFKTIATPKHFAVHSGPEADRHHFNAEASDQDLWETYLPAFEACFREGRANSVMGAYNRFRGESCSASQLLLVDILRGKWGFDGFVVSDVDSVADIHASHRITKTAAESAALAIKHGMDLNSGDTYRALPKAVKLGLCTEADVDRALERCLVARIKLGLFDPPTQVPYAQIPISVVDRPEHDALALKVAQESIVLLKNERGLLPLAKAGTVAVIGPNADEKEIKNGVLVGNYSGEPSQPVTFLAGIRKKLEGKGKVLYAKGCEVSRPDSALETEALKVAAQAEVVIMVLGLNSRIEGEEGEGGDRKNISLFPHQEKLLQQVAALGKPVVLVLAAGSAQAVNWAQAHVPAILDVWYPGQRGGDALADVLFGDYNPAGRLPVTFYKSEADLPDFKNYDMAGRTYRYFKGEPLYAFGDGLSYTTFRYDSAKVKVGKDGIRHLSVRVKNTGQRAGDEVVQLYVSRKDSAPDSGLPIRSLRGFKRVALKPGEIRTVTFHLTPFQFALVNPQGQRTVEPGDYLVGMGGSQKAAVSVNVQMIQRIANPVYAHREPSLEP